MSDDKYLGVALGCVPRRLFTLLLAAALCVYGAAGVLRLLVMRQLPGEAGHAAWHAQDRCVGKRCQDVLTCAGLQEASFHTREVVLLFGSVIFGYWGFLGALHSHAEELRWFGFFLVGMGALLLAVLLGDGAYTLLCGAYPLNVVDEALLWPLPGLPIREAVKYELRDAMVSYPMSFVDHLTELNVFILYFLLELAAVLFYSYAALQVLVLAQFTCHGSFGLGVNFDIRDWRERVLLKGALDRMADYRAAGAAESAS